MVGSSTIELVNVAFARVWVMMAEGRHVWPRDRKTERSMITARFRVLSVLVHCLAVTGCGPMTLVVGLSPGDQKLVETVVEPTEHWFSPRVAIVDVSGTIHSTGKPHLLGRGENPVSVLHENLDKAKKDPRVKAVILRLNTPGGTVTASDAMYRIVKRFKDESNKPVVALMMDVAASGGYYLACASDRILAYPTTVTGSIGVIVQTISVKPALNRIGVQTEAMTTGPNKDAGSPLSLMTDQHRAVLRRLIDDFYNRFLEVVRQARPGIPDDLFAQVTDGRVVTGQEAARLGLVDQTGDLYDAFDLAKQLSNMPHADLVLYHRPLDYVGSPYARTPMRHLPGAPGVGSNTQINIAQFNLPGTWAQPRPEFYYLWQLQTP